MTTGKEFMLGGTRVMLFRISLAVALAAYAVVAQAQVLPKPKEFYFDESADVTRRIVVVEGEGEALTEQLVKARERGRKQVEATAQLAHVAMSSDRVELGKSLYAQALASTQANSVIGRSVRWNYAWDLHRKGETKAAMELWAELARGFGQPAWVPPTLALGLWQTERKAEALQWYAAAVRTEPTLWSDPANFARLLPEWSEEDRARLAQVYAAWAADPPAWP